MRKDQEKNNFSDKLKITDNFLFLKTFVVPSLVSLIERVLTHPIDTIITFEQQKNLNAFAAIKHIYNTHGLLGYYRGLSYPLILSAPPGAIIVYGSYEGLKETFSRQKLNKTHSIFISSLISGFLCSLISTPLEAKRIRDTFGITSPHLQGMHYYYRGFYCNTTKLLLHAVIVLGGTDVLKYKLTQSNNDSIHENSSDSGNAHISFIGGLIFGAFSQLITTPLDVIKAKIMSDYSSNRLSFWQHGLKAYREKNLSSGLVTRMIKLGMHSGIMLGSISVFNTMLSKHFNHESSNNSAQSKM